MVLVFVICDIWLCFEKVLSELDRPSWKCLCCRASAGALVDRKKQRKETNNNNDSSVHEDVCLAFGYTPRGGRVDFDEWEVNFCQKIVMDPKDKVCVFLFNCVLFLTR